MCLVSELRATRTQQPPGREKGPPHHSPGCPDSSLPGPHPTNPPTSTPVPPGGFHGRGKQTRPRLGNNALSLYRLDGKPKSWGMQICIAHRYVYSWTMRECVPEASTQATSLCLWGTHLYSSAHLTFFWYMCTYFTHMRIYRHR